MPMGAILELEGKTIYHTGDTGLFSDMKLIADRHPVDICFVPIGDNFTMGIDDASYAINQFIKPQISIPIHYDTFPYIEQDPNDFKEAVSVGEVQKPENQLNYKTFNGLELYKIKCRQNFDFIVHFYFIIRIILSIHLYSNF